MEETVYVKRKANVGIYVMLVIVILVLCGVIGYLYFNNDECDNLKEDAVNKEEVNSEEKILPDMDHLSALINNYDSNFDCSSAPDYYLADSSVISYIDEKDKMLLTIQNINNDFVLESDFVITYNKLFGSDEKLVHQDIYVDGMLYYSYENNTYRKNEDFVWGCVAGNSVIRKVYDVEFVEDELVVYVAAGFLLFNKADDAIISFEKESLDSLDDNMIVTNDDYIVGYGSTFNINEEYRSLSSFKYTFRYYNEGMSYYLYSIEKMENFKN